ncbi:MAG: DUF3592 domain-containing protein [Verrucomicrobia bacterium]|nr:DUF3592 domain-containing protein [Verrucomicrobiota bacterium]
MNWFTTAFILIAIALALALREHIWLRKASITNGTIIEILTSQGQKGITSNPRVRYVAADGSPHEFTRSYYSSNPKYSVGQQVTVAYDRNSYEGRIVLFAERFIFAAMICCLGLAILVSVIIFQLGRSLVPRIYLQHQIISESAK